LVSILARGVCPENDLGAFTAPSTGGQTPGQVDRPLSSPRDDEVIKIVNVPTRQRPQAGGSGGLAQGARTHRTGSAAQE